ncbi:polysaccharide deacetylase family protein [Comamonas thiooxydans]|uniref:polysaccharide deacetylase family protein n=1 Tax=Comamonas thiooxydans TaxID=363952 RepID=UPI00070F1DCB|nr:polysaccharide deacetylase family protein [Comamonas thiooxydans]
MTTILRAIASLTVLLFSSSGFAQTLSLTFDDGLNPDRQAHAQVWNQQIITSLKDSGITAMVFPSLIRIGRDRGMGLVMDWAKAGHAVGNHTAAHRSLASAETTLDEFIADVKKADAALRHIPTWVPMLRFPYLKEGDTEEKRDGIRSWMKSNGYRPAPVSIDASDWYYNQIYSSLLRSGSHDKAVRVKLAYIEHLLDRAAYYEGLAKQVLGRSPAHVMLLHTNEINAAALPDIVSAFRKQGWTFVSATTAFKDPIYSSQPGTLPAGESVVWASAKARGISGLRYPAEDSVYEEPKLRLESLVP